MKVSSPKGRGDVFLCDLAIGLPYEKAGVFYQDMYVFEIRILRIVDASIFPVVPYRGQTF